MTDERAVRDNADEIQDQSQNQGDQGRPEQETTGPPGEAPPRGARPGDEGARLLRRVLQLEPAGVRWGPLELLVPYGRSGYRRHGAREGVPVRLARGALPLAREPGAAATVPGAGEIRQVRAVRRRDRLRATRRAAARPPVHQVQSEGRRWKTPLTAGRSGHQAPGRVPAGATSAGPGDRRLRAAAPRLQQVRGVRAVPGRRDLLALDLLRARHRRAVRAALHGDLGAAGRPVPAARVGARMRRGGRQRDRPDSQRPGASEGGRGGAALMAAVTFCVVTPETERLDRFLADQLALSRTVAARIIADKRVTRDGRPLRASVQLERGAVVSVELPPEQPPPKTYAPAHRDLTFAYEDEHLAVLDKPAGLVVHPGPGHWDDTLVNVLVGRGTALGHSAPEGRPGIVHRLDRDTSGLLLVAKTDVAHRRLARMIERHEVARVYAALAWGHFANSPVEIEAPITRHPKDRKRMTVLAGGRHAVTRVRVELGTGRTHQIRVHLAYVGHPVVGDREYAFGGSRRVTPSARGAAERIEALAPRQLLHAALLGLVHPVTGARLVLRSEWPRELAPALAEAGGDSNLLAQRNPLQYLGFFASDE